MSYPFFECVACSSRVQKAVFCVPGSLPPVAYLSRHSRFSSAFDEDSEFVRHCRGQGAHYHTRHEMPLLYPSDGVESLHSGCFAGLCCFCAFSSGFGRDAFDRTGCCNCVRKECMRKAFSGLLAKRRKDGCASSPSSAVSWASHGWAALPSALVDHILWFALGLSSCGDRVSVCNGRVLVIA